MKKRGVILVVVIALLALASAQAQDPTPPPPPVTISGTAVQSSGITAGDPTKNNGASAVSTTGIQFTGVSSDPKAGLLGTGTVKGNTSVFLNGNGTTKAGAGFRTIGTGSVNLNVGPSGSGTVGLNGDVSGTAIRTLGDCNTGNCAGAVVGGNANLNSLNPTISKGSVDATAVIKSIGNVQTKLGPTSAESMGTVMASVCTNQKQNPSAPPPCTTSGGCGGK